MSKIERISIPITIETEQNYRLVRHDGLTKHSRDIMWLEWDETGKFKERHSDPEVGRSLLMSPFNDFFTWQTTEITEILEQEDNYIKFKTKNSNYELWKND
jgi:hypothetical protein